MLEWSNLKEKDGANDPQGSNRRGLHRESRQVIEILLPVSVPQIHLKLFMAPLKLKSPPKS